MKTSLKTKLFLSFLILITIPMVILAIVSYTMTSKSMQQTIEQQLYDTTRLTAETITQTIESTVSLLQLESKDELVRTISSTSDPETKVAVFTMLQHMVKDNEQLIETMLITDDTGIAFMDNTNMNEVTDLSDRDYVQEALKGTYAISDVVTSKLTNEPIIGIAYPLFTDDNKVNGLLVGTIRFSKITEKVDQIKIGESGYGYMINNEGLVVAHPDKGKILTENLANNENTEIRDTAKQMIAGGSGSGNYTYEGVYKYVTYQPAEKWIVAVTANYDDYMAPALKIRTNSIIITTIAIIVALIAAIIIATRIVQPIRQLQSAMDSAGKGDLTVHTDIHSKDELEDLSLSFNSMVDNQMKIIHKVQISSDEMAASSEEMAASTEQVTNAAAEVAENTQKLAIEAEKGNQTIIDTSQALLELASLIQIAKNKASSAEENSHFTLSTANDGKDTVMDVIHRMDDIKEKMEETKSHISTLENYSIEITSITDTITQIAEQTNLLALNAAIEAARAGDAGKGFAVVADEVRKLAEQSNEGAAKVATLIRKITDTTASTVIATDQSSKQVDDGVTAVLRAGNALEKIVDAVHHTVKDVNGIVSITDNEVATSEKIVELINSLATFIESTAASAQEVSASMEETTASMETISATTEEVNSMAAELKGIIENFKLKE